LLVLEKGGKETPLHPLAQPLIHEFGDHFPNDLPLGLPLIKGIEHKIDVLPRASLPNRSSSMCNLLKTEEL